VNGPGADEHYWQALGEGRLEMQQCASCARWNWPAVWRCGECGSWEHHWHEVPLTGTIFTWTRTWHEFGAAKEFELPFVSVVVELDGAGHRRVMGTLAGSKDDVNIGARVTGNISRVTIDGESVPALVWKMGATK
jgi:uncharacterized protein